MNIHFKNALAVAAVAFSAQAAADITFYEREGFQGRSFTTERQIGNLDRFGFNDRASSVVVTSDRWEVCDDVRFGGRCAVLRPGRYPSLAAMGLNDRVSSVRDISRDARIEDSRYAPVPAVQDAAKITFFEREGFQGQNFSTDRQVGDFGRFGFNDRASSVVVFGDDRWEVCEDVRFNGRCVVLRPGRYPSLVAMGLNDRISSVRDISRTARIDDSRYAPAPLAVYDNRRRDGERLYSVPVTSVRAVVATPTQRCWTEQVPQERSGLNVPGAVIGAVIGGVLGHQIGSGRGNDVATVGGAVAGGALGANVGRDRNGQPTQDVQRCENVSSDARPDHWDVTYTFRGQEHRVQMTTDPGSTLTVNEQGEPRA